MEATAKHTRGFEIPCAVVVYPSRYFVWDNSFGLWPSGLSMTMPQRKSLGAGQTGREGTTIFHRIFGLH